MSWEVEFTDEFGAWWDELTDDEQDAIDRSVGLLEESGPTLGFPHTSDVKGSRHGRMRELRIQQANPSLLRMGSAPRLSIADWR
jgi:hypothetical protein